MLYFQVLFYTGSLLLLSYDYSQLIPDLNRTELVLGTLNRLMIQKKKCCTFGLHIVINDTVSNEEEKVKIQHFDLNHNSEDYKCNNYQNIYMF